MWLARQRPAYTRPQREDPNLTQGARTPYKPELSVLPLQPVVRSCVNFALDSATDRREVPLLSQWPGFRRRP